MHPAPLFLGPLFVLLASGCIHAEQQDDEPPSSRSLVVESEPNAGAARALELAVGETASGRIDANDEDWWRLDLAAGQIVSLQVFATRLDQPGWSGNPPALRVLAPDGESTLALRDAHSFGWGVLDPDLPALRVEEAGAHYIVLAAEDEQAAGAYLLVVQELGVEPVFELEPSAAHGSNDSSATAEELAPGVLYGYHVDDEDDWYRLRVAEPSLLTFAVLAQRNGAADGDDDTFDSELTLFDDAQHALASNDDGVFDDSFLSWLCTTPGEYFLRLGECCAEGDAPYFLIHEARPLTDAADEHEPNDTPSSAPAVRFTQLVRGTLGAGDRDSFAVPCLAGDRIELWLYDRAHHEGASAVVEPELADRRGEPLAMDLGSALGVRSVRITEDGLHFLSLTSAADEPSPYAFELRLETARWESEPDDTQASASVLDLDGRAAGRIDAALDADAFVFEAASGVPVLLECFADDEFGSQGFDELDGDGSDLDPLLEVRDPHGRVCAGASALARTAVGIVRGRSTVSVAFVPLVGGAYTCFVRDARGGSGPTYTYSLARH